MKKGWIAIISVVLLVASIIGIYAFYASKDGITNIFKVGEVNIEVDENGFVSPNNWDGTKYDKKVKIENLSTVDAFIRVAIVPRWIDEESKNWPGDTSFVKINYTNIVKANAELEGWVDGKDGYYYYNKKMAPTDKTTQQIIDSVSANIPDKDRYSGKKLIVDVKAEAVQAANGAYEVSWTTTSEEVKEMLKKLAQ